MVSNHALDQLRERAFKSMEFLTDRALAERLDKAVDVNFTPKRLTVITFKGRECWIVDLGHHFVAPLYAAVVDSEKKGRFKQAIVTVLTRAQFDENQRTGKWSGWFSPNAPLKASMGEHLKGKR